ncbi:hypothetical protein D3C83_73380 [compost metagenome]
MRTGPLPKCPMSAYSASAPVTASTTEPSTKLDNAPCPRDPMTIIENPRRSAYAAMDRAGSPTRRTGSNAIPRAFRMRSTGPIALRISSR